MERNLTDSDVEAICDELESRFAKRFYLNVGKGVVGIILRWVLYGIIFLAAYGAAKGHLPFFKD